MYGTRLVADNHGCNTPTVWRPDTHISLNDIISVSIRKLHCCSKFISHQASNYRTDDRNSIKERGRWLLPLIGGYVGGLFGYN